MLTLGCAGAVLLLQAALSQAPVMEPPPEPVPAAAPRKKWVTWSGEDADWHVDWLVGLPTACRVQWDLQHDPANTWLLEIFGGVEIVVPMVGGGVRRRFTCFDDGHLSFSVAPGLDAFVGSALIVNLAGLTADVDFLFTKRLRRGGSAAFGVKLGASAVGAAGFFGGGDRVLPVASFIFGRRW